ncbi:MAG: TlpA family protein disulfide reductase [Bacteroidetes bacterium]|nr:TlpA family protein disulfide reductase [Bacteroidota bacterium]
MVNSSIALILMAGWSIVLAPGEGAKVGEAAPKLSVDEWIQGTPVSDFQKGTAYVVEFWGTWCSPCLKNIPKLNEVQNQNASKGLVVIGVASHEFKGRAELGSFMEKRGSELGYRIAYDGDLSMEHDWDTGGNADVQFRMPLCFVINRQGIVVFAGHPENEGFDAALTKVLSE